MNPNADLTLEEKIRLIQEQGKSASEVHSDPNSTMAFTRFAGTDPNPTQDDDNYASKLGGKRKMEPDTEDLGPAKRVRKPDPAQQGLKSASTNISRVKVWQEDEIVFALEKYAENPDLNGNNLRDLINEEFSNKPVIGGDGKTLRGERSRQSVWQRFTGRGVKEALLTRLDAETDRNAVSMSWSRATPSQSPTAVMAVEGEDGIEDEEVEYHN